MLEGLRLVRDALESQAKFHFCIVDPSLTHRYLDLLDHIERARIPVYSAGRKEFHELSDTVNSQGLLALVDQPDTHHAIEESLHHAKLILFLDRISDPGNLGTIIRTCDWFGVSMLCLSAECADPFSPKVVRSSMGSIFRVPIHEVESMEDFFQKAKIAGFKMYSAVAHDGISFLEVEKNERSILFFGSEAHGIAQEILDRSDVRLSITGIGNAESLNVAVSVGIALHAWRS